MGRQLSGRRSQCVLQARKPGGGINGSIVQNRIGLQRHVALPYVNGQPGRFPEKIVFARDQPATTPEVLDLLRQAVRNLHRRTVVPKVTVTASVEMIVKNQEIPDALRLAGRNSIELPRDQGVEISVGKEGKQL